VIASSVPVLRERASLQPNDTASTFIDYDRNWDAVAETRRGRRPIGERLALRKRSGVIPRPVIGLRYWHRRARTTSLDFWEHCTSGLLQFRFRFQ
jgi:hypothetical protein